MNNILEKFNLDLSSRYEEFMRKKIELESVEEMAKSLKNLDMYQIKYNNKKINFHEEKALVYTELLEIEALIEYFKCSSEQIISEKVFFYPFDSLSNIFKSYKYKVREQYEIIFKLLEDNVAMLNSKNVEKEFGLLANAWLYCGNFKAEIMTSYVEHNSFKNAIKDLSDIYNGNRKKMIEKCLDETRIIYEHFFLKKENFSENDIEKVENALINMGVTPLVAIYFRKKMLEKSEHRKVDGVKVNKPEHNENIYKEVQKNYVSDKEYKQMRKEVKSYLNKAINKEEFDLSFEEILRISRNFLMVGYDIGDAIFFARCADIMEKEKQDNALADYASMYDKLCFYRNMGVDIFDEFNDMKECMDNMMICDDESYVTWKNILEETMEQVRGKLEYKDDYERQLIKK